MIQPLRPGPSGRSASPSAFARCSGDQQVLPRDVAERCRAARHVAAAPAIAAGQRVQDRYGPVCLAGVHALADAIPCVVGDGRRARDDLRRLGKLVRRHTADLGDTLGRKRRRGLGEHIERGAAGDRPAQRLHLAISAELRDGIGHQPRHRAPRRTPAMRPSCRCANTGHPRAHRLRRRSRAGSGRYRHAPAGWHWSNERRMPYRSDRSK